MSRVYNVLTGATRPVVGSVATVEAPDDAHWASNDDSPFVEIGGPSGPIFSPVSRGHATPVVAPPKPVAESKPEPKAEATLAFPRLVPPALAPAYLSVRFHDATARLPRPAVEGPDAALVALHFPEHAVSSEYRVLRDEIRKQLPVASARVLQFASAAPEAGTTTVLLNLAITLAHESKTRVAVVDANVGRAAVAAKLALKPAPGLCEVLAGDVPLAWALQPSAVPNLQVLAAGEPTHATTATLGRDFSRLLSQLRQWFDWVIVDSGVWGGVPERDAVCPAADAVYLVTRNTDTDRPEFLNVRTGVKDLGGLLRGYVSTRM